MADYSDRKPMTEDELKVFCDNRYAAATSYRDTEVATRRKIVRDYYDGKPLGNEVQDRSQAIQFEVRSKIEGILPGLIDVFFGEEDVVTIEPDDEVYEDLVTEEGEMDADALAKRVDEIQQAMRDATDHVNDVFLKQNEGFLIGYTAMQDALKEITGVIKVWCEEVEHENVEYRTGIFDHEMDELLDDDDIELRDIGEPYEVEVAGSPEMVRDAAVATIKRRKKIRVGILAPEDFGIDDDAVATDREGWKYMYHVRLATRTELIKEGYDPEVVYSIPTYQGSATNVSGSTGVTVPRRRSNTNYDTQLEPSQEEVRVVEHFGYVDFDGDGVGEPRKVTIAGNAGTGGVVLDNEVWDDDWPFYIIQAILKPHEFFGLAYGELSTNHQLISSTVYREWLDNIYGANNNRVKVFESQENQVDMAAVYAKRQDTPVRIRAKPGEADVVPMPHIDLGGNVLPLLEYIDRRSEIDTGQSRYAAGIDADDLNETAHGMERITTKAEERQALIARLMAETGFNRVFLAIYDLSRKYLAGPRPHARAGEVRVINPGTWPANVGITMDVGLGHGSPMERRANAGALISIQKDAAGLGYVSRQNGYNGITTAVRALGFKSAKPYFTDPSTPAGKAEMERISKQNETSDVDKLIQVEMSKVQQRAEEAQLKYQAQINQLQEQLLEASQKSQLEQAQFLADQRQSAIDNMMEMRKLVSNVALEIANLQLEAGQSVNIARDADQAEDLATTALGGANGSAD